MELFGQDISIMILLFLLGSAFAAGFIDSIAGGGGLILVPSFLLSGMPPQLALGQEKIVSTLGTITAIRNFIRNKKVVWWAVGMGIPAGLVGAFCGTKAILFFEPDTIGKIILFMLPFGILLSFIPKDNAVEDKPINRKVLLLGVPASVFVIGFYDGFFGPGTGSFLIIVLHYLLRFDLLAASATSKLFNFSSNIGALIAFMLAGHVAYLLAIPLVAMNMWGNHVGSANAVRYGAKMIRKVLTLSLTLLMLTLGYQYFA